MLDNYLETLFFLPVACMSSTVRSLYRDREILTIYCVGLVSCLLWQWSPMAEAGFTH